jgi:hypothetical protein
MNKQKDGRPCIYMIKNCINNKIYIGSAMGHYRRKGQHYYMLRRNIHFNKHLQSAWNKYKEKNFKFEILEFVEDILKLQEKEEFFINLYKSNIPNNGYNHRINCSTSIGIKWSEEARRHFSEKKKGKIPPHLNYIEIAKLNNKKVVAINKITKEQLFFNSIKEAGEILNIGRTNISKVLHNKLKSTGNYYWKFWDSVKNTEKFGEFRETPEVDNPDPSSTNDIKVIEKEQRLIGEESTNNPNTSAEQDKYLINFEKMFNSFQGEENKILMI